MIYLAVAAFYIGIVIIMIAAVVALEISERVGKFQCSCRKTLLIRRTGYPHERPVLPNITCKCGRRWSISHKLETTDTEHDVYTYKEIPPLGKAEVRPE